MRKRQFTFIVPSLECHEWYAGAHLCMLCAGGHVGCECRIGGKPMTAPLVNLSFASTTNAEHEAVQTPSIILQIIG